MAKQASGAAKSAPDGFRVVEVSREPVELYKILKFEGIVGSGGEAKAAVASGVVLLNGEVETQKRKKIVSGDTIELGEEKIWIRLSAPASDEVVALKVTPPKATPAKAIPATATPAKATPSKATPAKATPSKAAASEATPPNPEAKPVKKKSTMKPRARIGISKGSKN